MVGVRGDDPHALAFSPWNLRSCLDYLIWQLGGDIAQAADDGLTRKAQRSPSVPFLDPQVRLPHQPPRPDPPEGRQLPWSQLHGLGANVLVTRLESAPRNNVHPDAKEFLKVLEQANVIKKRCPRLKVHQQVQVAVHQQVQVAARAGRSPGNGAEYRDPARPPLPRNAEDLYPAAPQPLQGQRVIDHRSRVSPPAGRRSEPKCGGRRLASTRPASMGERQVPPEHHDDGGMACWQY
jgi:hypothetical protein